MQNIKGQTLRKARTGLNLTQEQMGGLMGCQSFSVCKHERNKRHGFRFNLKYLKALDEYAQCYACLRDCVSDIDYYDKDEAAALRAEAFEIAKFNKRLERGKI